MCGSDCWESESKDTCERCSDKSITLLFNNTSKNLILNFNISYFESFFYKFSWYFTSTVGNWEHRDSIFYIIMLKSSWFWRIIPIMLHTSCCFADTGWQPNVTTSWIEYYIKCLGRFSDLYTSIILGISKIMNSSFKCFFSWNWLFELL